MVIITELPSHAQTLQVLLPEAKVAASEKLQISVRLSLITGFTSLIDRESNSYI